MAPPPRDSPAHHRPPLLLAGRHVYVTLRSAPILAPLFRLFKLLLRLLLRSSELGRLCCLEARAHREPSARDAAVWTAALGGRAPLPTAVPGSANTCCSCRRNDQDDNENSKDEDENDDDNNDDNNGDVEEVNEGDDQSRRPLLSQSPPPGKQNRGLRSRSRTSKKTSRLRSRQKRAASSSAASKPPCAAGQNCAVYCGGGGGGGGGGPRESLGYVYYVPSPEFIERFELALTFSNQLKLERLALESRECGLEAVFKSICLKKNFNLGISPTLSASSTWSSLFLIPKHYFSPPSAKPLTAGVGLGGVPPKLTEQEQGAAVSSSLSSTVAAAGVIPAPPGDQHGFLPPQPPPGMPFETFVLSQALVVVHQQHSLRFEIEDLIRVKFSPENKAHLQKLQALWTLMMNSVNVQDFSLNQGEKNTGASDAYPGHKGDHWVQIGFQGKDPSTDFRGMGMFCLDFLHYIASNHNDLARHILAGSMHESAWYSYAIVGINVLAYAVGALRARRLARLLYVHGPTLESVFLFATYVFASFNKVWVSLRGPRRLTPLDFSCVFKEVCESIETDLARGVLTVLAPSVLLNEN